MCPTSHRSLTEKAKLIAKLFNTVPKHKGILLSDDESIKQWISHMKDVTNSKHQSMMTAISKVYHLGVVHAKARQGDSSQRAWTIKILQNCRGPKEREARQYLSLLAASALHDRMLLRSLSNKAQAENMIALD
ncbi:hypothetical protein V8E54_003791 [Elaphomyces granulatus]